MIAQLQTALSPFLQTWVKVKFGALESIYFSKFWLPPATKPVEHTKVSDFGGAK
jgi:hypothetical protein